MNENTNAAVANPLSDSAIANIGALPLELSRIENQQEKEERIARYSSPEFTHQLLEHMHEAKKLAILQFQEQPEK